MEVLKPIVFYGGSLKPMVFNKNFERLFLRFKKISKNMFPMDGLAGETANLSK